MEDDDQGALVTFGSLRMVHGSRREPWCMVHGAWFPTGAMVHGAWFWFPTGAIVHGAWCWFHGACWSTATRGDQGARDRSSIKVCESVALRAFDRTCFAVVIDNNTTKSNVRSRSSSQRERGRPKGAPPGAAGFPLEHPGSRKVPSRLWAVRPGPGVPSRVPQRRGSPKHRIFCIR